MPVINTNSVYSLPLEASYSKWDKYDPDVELMKLDNKEKVEKLQAQKRKNLNSSNLSVSLNDDATSHHDRVKSIKNYVDSMSKSKFNVETLVFKLFFCQNHTVWTQSWLDIYNFLVYLNH